MQNVIVGTSGHVDHGKTCLIKALSGIDTDRLKEEQKRGITIELGFANLPNDEGLHIGIIDVPGHEKFVKNMLAGIGGIDLVLLVIGLDEGVMPQTVEHFEILKMLHSRQGIIVFTKSDLVDEEWAEMVEEDVNALALKVQELFDDELIANNPQEEYLTELKSEIASFQTSNSQILNYSTSSSVDVDYFEEDGCSFARIYGTYYLQVQKNLKSLEEVFLLRKDEEGHWKLYGWQPIENNGGE